MCEIKSENGQRTDDNDKLKKPAMPWAGPDQHEKKGTHCPPSVVGSDDSS